VPLKLPLGSLAITSPRLALLVTPLLPARLQSPAVTTARARSPLFDQLSPLLPPAQLLLGSSPSPGV
jgi:hypothetical protein